jgi:hypothetical protein
MKIEQQVCTIEQSFKLQDLGVLQDAHYYRMENDDNEIVLMRRDEIIKIFEENILDTKREEEGIQNGQMISYRESDLQNLAQQIFSSAISKFDHDIVAAFTVAELGVMLNDECTSYKAGGFNGWMCSLKQGKSDVSIGGKTEAEARANMLIYLLENNLISFERVNIRLS